MTEARRMKIAVTGAAGFIGKNLIVRLRETDRYEPLPLTRETSDAETRDALSKADAIIHLAGVNRPKSEAEFASGNAGATELLCSLLNATGSKAPILFASSSRASEDTPYGRSKAAAESVLLDHGTKSGSIVSLFRLPNVFGKWSRPNYNSAVATFCHNVAHALPTTVHDPASPVTLVYVDDVIDQFVRLIESPPRESGYCEVAPVYPTSVGALAETIQGFRSKRERFVVDTVGGGLERALYATYISTLEPAAFAYPLIKHEDKRGWFSEFVKTESAGQVSVFTAHPGVTRGGHYHHTKTEKFLVVQGEALFKFRHVTNDATHDIRINGSTLTVVETVPGWAHDVTNVGDGLMVCVLWANEAFDPAKPDTIAHKV
jgi:UDP-2-acetamido-2,6-beta-L-arabino-hexul-4-ose reductase